MQHGPRVPIESVENPDPAGHENNKLRDPEHRVTGQCLVMVSQKVLGTLAVLHTSKIDWFDNMREVVGMTKLKIHV